MCSLCVSGYGIRFCCLVYIRIPYICAGARQGSAQQMCRSAACCCTTQSDTQSHYWIQVSKPEMTSNRRSHQLVSNNATKHERSHPLVGHELSHAITPVLQIDCPDLPAHVRPCCRNAHKERRPRPTQNSCMYMVFGMRHHCKCASARSQACYM